MRMKSDPSIRLACDGDVDGVLAIYAPVVRDTATSFEYEPPTRADMLERMRAGEDRFPWLVHAPGDEVRGYAYAGPHRVRDAYQWSVEVSVYVAGEHRRQGVGRALYDHLLALLTRQGFARAFAGITLPNAGSVALHESMGFVPVGIYERVGCKQGRWWDVGWWQRDLAPVDPRHAAPPRPVSGILSP